MPHEIDPTEQTDETNPMNQNTELPMPDLNVPELNVLKLSDLCSMFVVYEIDKINLSCI
jgi:hypothetical protein